MMIGEFGGCNRCGRLCPRAGRGRSLRSGAGASWTLCCILHPECRSLPAFFCCGPAVFGRELGALWGMRVPLPCPAWLPSAMFFFSHVGPLPHGQCSLGPGPAQRVPWPPRPRTEHHTGFWLSGLSVPLRARSLQVPTPWLCLLTQVHFPSPYFLLTQVAGVHSSGFVSGPGSWSPVEVCIGTPRLSGSLA